MVQGMELRLEHASRRRRSGSCRLGARPARGQILTSRPALPLRTYHIVVLALLKKIGEIIGENFTKLPFCPLSLRAGAVK